MNIWTQFLPGVREARVPLAVGALWVTAAALLARHLPAALLKGELVSGAKALIALLPGPIAGAAVLFGVYLLGIILNEVGTIIVRVTVAILQLVPVLLAGAAFILIISLSIRLLVFIAAMFAFLAYLSWRRLSDVSYWEYLSQVLDQTLVRMLRGADEAWNAVVAAWDPSRGQIVYIMREEASRILATTTDLRTTLIESLPIRRLANVARAVKLQDADIRKARSELASPNDPATVAKALRLAKTDATHAPLIRAALNDRIAMDTEARREFVSVAVNTTRLQRDIKDRVDRAHVHLRAQYETIYDEYDRLRAEGEFRIAVVAPLTALLAAVTYLIARDINVDPEISQWFYAGPVLAGLSMLAAGSEKKGEASQLLYSSIRQQLVPNADTHEYGLEYFPIKFWDIGIDLSSPPVPRPVKTLLRAVRKPR